MHRTWTRTAALALAVCVPAFAADVTVDDEHFVTRAALAGLMEVELARLALATSQDHDVRAFAELMLADHEKANAELSSLAAEGRVSMPTTPDAKQQEIITYLEGLSGEAFDEAYALRMEAEHEKAIDLFRSATKSESVTPAIAQYAKEMLSTLDHHHDMAEDLVENEDD
jgi:putative membrane protein